MANAEALEVVIVDLEPMEPALLAPPALSATPSPNAAPDIPAVPAPLEPEPGPPVIELDLEAEQMSVAEAEAEPMVKSEPPFESDEFRSAPAANSAEDDIDDVKICSNFLILCLTCLLFHSLTLTHALTQTHTHSLSSHEYRAKLALSALSLGLTVDNTASRLSNVVIFLGKCIVS